MDNNISEVWRDKEPEIFFRRVLFEKFLFKVALDNNVNFNGFWYDKDSSIDVARTKFIVRECYNKYELESYSSLNRETTHFSEVYIVERGDWKRYAILKRHCKK